LDYVKTGMVDDMPVQEETVIRDPLMEQTVSLISKMLATSHDPELLWAQIRQSAESRARDLRIQEALTEILLDYTPGEIARVCSMLEREGK
jgi:hypothetical protein